MKSKYYYKIWTFWSQLDLQMIQFHSFLNVKCYKIETYYVIFKHCVFSDKRCSDEGSGFRNKWKPNALFWQKSEHVRWFVRLGPLKKSCTIFKILINFPLLTWLLLVQEKMRFFDNDPSVSNLSISPKMNFPMNF